MWQCFEPEFIFGACLKWERERVKINTKFAHKYHKKSNFRPFYMRKGMCRSIYYNRQFHFQFSVISNQYTYIYISSNTINTVDVCEHLPILNLVFFCLFKLMKTTQKNNTWNMVIWRKLKIQWFEFTMSCEISTISNFIASSQQYERTTIHDFFAIVTLFPRFTLTQYNRDCVWLPWGLNQNGQIKMKLKRSSSIWFNSFTVHIMTAV